MGSHVPSHIERTIIDTLVDRRRVTVSLAVIITAVLALFIPGMTTDPTLKSGVDTNSAAYGKYLEFIDIFGSEEFILIAVKNRHPIHSSEILKSLQSITREIEKLDTVTKVVSLSNLRVFRPRQGVYGTYGLVETKNSLPTLVAEEPLREVRDALPISDFLLSPDERSYGVLVRLDEKWGFDVPVINRTLESLNSIVRSNLPVGSEYRIVGAPIIRASIHKYNVQTAIIFGILCLSIATSISLYIFKSLKVSAITMVIMSACVAWILSFMSLAGIPLNSTTGLSFGLVLIVSVATVIRIVTHFNERYARIQDRVEASRQALQTLFTPCLMCAATTAVGFGSIMVTSIPMVFQLGLIMSLGVIISFVLCIVLTPAFLIVMRPLSARSYDKMSHDWVSLWLAGIEKAVFKHYRLCVVAGVALTAIMIAAIPSIHSDTQILRMLSERTQEMADIHFVEKNLTPIHSVELLIEAEPNTFKRSEVWEKVRDMEKALKALPEVVATDSFLPMLQYLARQLQGSGSGDKALFSDPGLVSDLIALTSLSADGRTLMHRFLDKGFGRLHVSVKIKNSPGIPISDTIDEVQETAASELQGVGKVSVTGDVAVFAAQASGLVRSQLYSLVLAFVLISLLLMIHLKSPVLGLISLVPNVVPVVAILGTMGWLGISLDTVTVFCAAVALGLAVDDTVHFLKQLRYELKARTSDKTFEECVKEAFELTAKAMVSTSTVLFFGFIMLLLSPFRPVNSFGVLSAMAIVAALFGDVLLLPSLLLSSPTLRRWIAARAAISHQEAP